MVRRLFALITLCLTALSFAAAIHIHGEGSLQIAVENDSVDMVLTLPAMDVVGFEGHPDTDLQRSQIDAAVAKLKSAGDIFLFAEEAGCVAMPVTVSGGQLGHARGHSHAGHGHGHDHGRGHHNDQNNEHADFVAHYQFQCERIESLNNIEVHLFRWLPEMSLRVEMITPAGARLAKLNHRAPVLEVPVRP